MLFSYNWLQSFFAGKLPDSKKLAGLLTMRSFEVKEVRKITKDWLLDIDVLPNRAHDCLSHLGMAREISAILKKGSKRVPSHKLSKTKSSLAAIKLAIRPPSLASRYSAIIIEGVKIGPSPRWLKDRLSSLEVNSINNVVDITNFVMLELGQPLHAFDYDKIKGRQMTVRMAKEGEKITTLDGVERKLSDGIIVIEDSSRLIDLAGIMGGEVSQIDNKTKNIVLQAANFDSRSIWRAAKALNHATIASSIYSQGIDPNLTIAALERASLLLAQTCGGKIAQIIDFYPKKVLPKKIQLDLEYLDSLLGAKTPESEIKDILKRLGFGIGQVAKRKLRVEIPTRRQDVSLPEDLIEEIGRIKGYEGIKPEFPAVSLIPPQRNESLLWQGLTKNILKELRFTEVYSYSFIGDSEASALGYNKEELVELENPQSSDKKYLRPDLLAGLLGAIKSNSRNFDSMRIFGLAKIFLAAEKESKALSAVIAEKNPASDIFYEAKGVMDALLQKLGISGAWYDSYKPAPKRSQMSLWHPQKLAEIKVGNKEIGFLGELSPRVAEKLGISLKTAIINLDFEKLSELALEETVYQPFSKFPAAVRDLAVLVSQETKVVDVLNIINNAGGALIKDVDLFDIYEGKELPEKMKNLAFHIIYQTKNRTLTSKEVDKLHQKIINALEENPEWEVRK